nr:condensation domain-containing protein [Zhouia spongiae]
MFNKDSTSKFKGLLKAEEGITSFMRVLSLVNVLLYKYTGQGDIILGSPISGRDHPDLEGQIGFYVNTLALRTRFNGNDSFEAVLSKVKEMALGGYSHQSYPFDSLVDELSLSRDTSRHPLFDVMVTYQESEGKEPELDEESKSSYENTKGMSHVVSKFDLTFNFEEKGNELGIGIEYSSDLFARSTIERMLNHIGELLTSIVASPEVSISSLSYIPQREQSILLEEFNETATIYPKEKTIVDLFEEQVEKTPNRVAVVFEGKELTYCELNERANQLARYLHSNYKIESDTLIGIKMDRSLDIIISIIGVLKSGGAYVPIDPEYPQSRIDYIITDSRCELLLDRLAYDKFEQSQEDYIKDNLGTFISSSDLAYVIYTSGSTGQPKGVMIEHRGILNTIVSQNKIFELKKHKRSLQFASYSFDASVSEIFISLTSGVVLYLVGDKERKVPELLESFIIEKSIEIATIPPLS